MALLQIENSCKGSIMKLGEAGAKMQVDFILPARSRWIWL